jgi:hypothetical protein
VLFPGLRDEQKERYIDLQRSAGNDFQVPDRYRSIISRVNGASLFRLNLCGLPPSMCQDPPLLNRSTQQPLDLGTANQHWRKKYSEDPAPFHFGARPYTEKENLAYFLKSNGGVIALLPGCLQLREWPSMEMFLDEELSSAEEKFGTFERG